MNIHDALSWDGKFEYSDMITRIYTFQQFMNLIIQITIDFYLKYVLEKIGIQLYKRFRINLNTK